MKKKIKREKVNAAEKYSFLVHMRKLQSNTSGVLRMLIFKAKNQTSKNDPLMHSLCTSKENDK